MKGVVADLTAGAHRINLRSCRDDGPVMNLGVGDSCRRTFFGIGAKVTRRVVDWLLATPVYTDQGAYAELNQLRAYVTVAGWALFTLVFTVAGVRYYASGFTSYGSYEAVEALTRGGFAAGALALYPELLGSLCVACNYLTYEITHAPAVAPGLTKLLGAATVSNFKRSSASMRTTRVVGAPWM